VYSPQLTAVKFAVGPPLHLRTHVHRARAILASVGTRAVETEGRPMDRGHLEQMLKEMLAERSEAEHRLAALQKRVDALRRAAEGIDDLLSADPEVADETPDESGIEPATEALPSPDAPSNAPSSGSSGPSAEPPRGGEAARIVLRSTPGRFFTSREVWDEEVRRGWIEPTSEALAAVRIALKRLRERDTHVRFLDGPTHAYCWDDNSA